MTNSLSGQDRRTILLHLQNLAPNSINTTTISHDEEGNSCSVCVHARMCEREILKELKGGFKIELKLLARTWDRENLEELREVSKFKSNGDIRDKIRTCVNKRGGVQSMQRMTPLQMHIHRICQL